MMRHLLERRETLLSTVKVEATIQKYLNERDNFPFDEGDFIYPWDFDPRVSESMTPRSLELATI